MTHIFASKLPTIGSYNDLSPGRRQAIIWTNAGILLIWPIGTNFNEILIEMQPSSLTKMHLKMSSAKWLSFCLGQLSIAKFYKHTHNVNTLKPRQIRHHFAIFTNENFWISIILPQKCVPTAPIYNKSAWVQIMVWHRTGDMPPVEPMVAKFHCAYVLHSGSIDYSNLHGLYGLHGPHRPLSGKGR